VIVVPCITARGLQQNVALGRHDQQMIEKILRDEAVQTLREGAA